MHKIHMIGLVLLCTACTVGPDYKRPEIYTDTQISKALSLDPKSEKVSETWYELFNDKCLNGLIERALKENTSVAEGISRLRQARLSLKINQFSFAPTLSADASYDWARFGKKASLTGDTNYMQLGFDATWELDIWGASRRLTEQSRAAVNEADYQLKNIQTTLTAEVAQTYFNLLTTLEKLRIAKRNLSVQRDIYATVKSRYQAGLTDLSAYRQADYAVQSTLALIGPLEAEAQNYRNALAVLIGGLPDQLPPIDETSASVALGRSIAFDLSRLTALPADVIRLRPDVQASEQALVAQNAAIGQAVAAMYPTISLSGLFGVRSSAGSQLFNRVSKIESYSPSAVLPLWNWGKLENNVTLQKEKTNETYLAYKQSILEAVQELGNAITGVAKSKESLKAQTRAVARMKEAFNAIRKQYESGLIEFSALLQAEQNLLTTETALATDRGTLLKNIIAFYKATGGGRSS